jgi:ABC-type sugar transport system permease subunit
MRLLDITVAGAVFITLAAMVVTALGYPPEARLVPLVIGIPTLLLAAFQLWRDATRLSTTATAVDGHHPPEKPTEGRALRWLFFFVLLVLAGGFTFGGSLAVVVSQRFWLRESWRIALIGGAIAFLLLHFVLERQFGLSLFSGWVAAWMRT